MVHPIARRWLPIVSTGVAMAALGFQTGVLYPWHHELYDLIIQTDNKNAAKTQQLVDSLNKAEERLDRITRLLEAQQASRGGPSLRGKGAV